jgi:hypothetical protein
MNRELLLQYLQEGKSTREIEKLIGLDHRTISYWIQKYSLSQESTFRKLPVFKFEKIDSREKAYTLGFILADSAINRSIVEVSVSLSDKEVLDEISKLTSSEIRISNTLDIQSRRFPRARICRKIHDITKFIGAEKKEDRHYPIIRDDLERYLIQGFFDAEGCITWGRRKDNGRIWQKVTFASQLKILLGVQTYLLKKLNISSIVRPKSDEKCYVLEFANKHDVLVFLGHIYDNNDYIILKRKYLKYKALRLELEENGEGAV